MLLPVIIVIFLAVSTLFCLQALGFAMANMYNAKADMYRAKAKKLDGPQGWS